MLYRDQWEEKKQLVSKKFSMRQEYFGSKIYKSTLNWQLFCDFYTKKFIGVLLVPKFLEHRYLCTELVVIFVSHLRSDNLGIIIYSMRTSYELFAIPGSSAWSW